MVLCKVCSTLRAKLRATREQLLPTDAWKMLSMSPLVSVHRQPQIKRNVGLKSNADQLTEAPRLIIVFCCQIMSAWTYCAVPPRDSVQPREDRLNWWKYKQTLE